MTASATTKQPEAQAKQIHGHQSDESKKPSKGNSDKVQIKIPEKGIYLPNENKLHTCDLFVTRLLDQGLYLTLNSSIPRETPIGEVFGGGIMIKAVKIGPLHPKTKLPLVRFGVKAPKFLSVKKEEEYSKPYEVNLDYVKQQIDYQQELNPLESLEYFSNVHTALKNIQLNIQEELRKLKDAKCTFQNHPRYHEYLSVKEQHEEVLKELRRAQDKKSIAQEQLDKAKSDYTVKYAKSLIALIQEELPETQVRELLEKVKASATENFTDVERIASED